MPVGNKNVNLEFYNWLNYYSVMNKYFLNKQKHKSLLPIDPS